MSTSTLQHELFGRIRHLVGADLLEVEKVFHAELKSQNGYVEDLLAHAARFTGKRLRPILLLLTAKAVRDINPAHHTLAAVVEMIHTATLVHDDVLDEAETRRHVATLNNRWNNETSVLFGDYLFTHAFHLAASLETTRACRLIGRSTNIVCEGELSQIRSRGNFDLSEDEYFRIIDGKTGELCAVACELGALYADGADEVVKAMTQYGHLLGMAFQIADDVLDMTGTEGETGKTLGTDLQKQKLTLPLIRLLSQSTPGQGQVIRELLSQPDEHSIKQLMTYLANSDALEYTQQKAFEFAANARQELQVLPASPARDILEELADFATQRNF